MAGVIGPIAGVGKDIGDYLEAVGKYFEIQIEVTSGKRDGDEQAQAMWNNWLKLKRGAVYHKATLPEADQKTLDDHYKLAKETPASSAADKDKAEQAFLKLAKEKVGSKSKHVTGRAVDVRTSTVDDKVYKAIVMRMTEVKEGDRDDIYHFESTALVSAVDDATKEAWKKIKAGS